MVPRRIAAGRVNLGDRVDRGNVAFLVEAFAAAERGSRIGTGAAADPRSQLRRSNIRVWDRTIPTKGIIRP
jgi:hypothetical protein